MKILYRPHRCTLDEAMAEVQEFKSIKEMCEYLVRQYKGAFNVSDGYIQYENAFNVSDIYISYYGYDDRIDWDTYIVTVGRYGPENYMEKYHSPQGIGFCTIKERELTEEVADWKAIAEQYHEDKAKLTEENEKIGIDNFNLTCELTRIKEDTVWKMVEGLDKQFYHDHAIRGVELRLINVIIGRVVKEMLEDST